MFWFFIAVVMVMLILDDIKYFVFVLSCVLVGFAQGFWLLMSGAYPFTSFTDVKDSYFSTFMFMFGQIDQEQIENSRSGDFTKVFLVVFMITMMILLFNLLIALMGDSFDRTKERIETHYRKELASFLVDQSAPISFATLLQALGFFKPPEDEKIWQSVWLVQCWWRST
jgi:fucose 4-O-acetylase-like acetyltransferase